MGNWTLEICKMALYMSFPVGLFHIFNQPAYFEEWVTDTKREIYPPDNETHRKQIEEVIRDMRLKQENQMLKAIEQAENKNKIHS